MKKLIFSVLLCCVAIVASAQVQRPKLVVGIVIDQMRWDYLYYYYDKFGEGGMKRLINEGFSCDNQMVNYVPTVTGVGHASLYTGAGPATNGIASNDFRMGDKMVYCCDDPSVQGVGTTSKSAQMSPHYMLGTTIGDMLRQATDFKAKVFGVAIKDRAAILPAGHSANGAFWYDKSVAGFVTSSYYMDKLPDYVVKFNKQNTLKKGYDPKSHADGVTVTFDMAEAIMKAEKLGQNGTTDMLCVSISSTDAISHQTGTWCSPGKENEEVFLTLDRDIKKFFDALDAQVGKDGYLLFLTADHAGTHNPNTQREHKLVGGSWDKTATLRQVNEALSKKFGVEGKYFNKSVGFSLYLDHAFLAQNNLDIEAVKAAAIAELKKVPELITAVDYEKAAVAALPQWIRERIINGYYKGRSGDIYAVVKANYFDWNVKPGFYGSTHGSWNPADTHIPLIFMGWNVKPGKTNRLTTMVDTAPTVCAMLHVQAPDASTGNPIVEVVDQK